MVWITLPLSYWCVLSWTKVLCAPARFMDPKTNLKLDKLSPGSRCPVPCPPLPWPLSKVKFFPLLTPPLYQWLSLSDLRRDQRRLACASRSSVTALRPKAREAWGPDSNPSLGERRPRDHRKQRLRSPILILPTKKLLTGQRDKGRMQVPVLSAQFWLSCDGSSTTRAVTYDSRCVRLRFEPCLACGHVTSRTQW